MSTVPTTEDRIWAVLAHLSALAFGMGIALPVVGWSDQRRKSNYAAFQSLQALGYQSLGFTVWALSCLMVVVVAAFILLVLLGTQDGAGGQNDMQMRLWIILISLVLIGLLAMYFVLPVLAAVACLLGRDFRYPILGDRLARYLGYEPAQSQDKWLNEEHEIRWVAAMGHFSILIVLWGMLAPLTAWILRGKQDLFLKFQSIQTLAYQALATVLFFLGMFFYSAGVSLLFAGLGTIEEVRFDSPIGIAGIVLFAVSVLMSILLLLCLPLMHILGQWAGYRVLKGENYRYPVAGRLVDKWVSSQPDTEENSK